jgi:hypothetical protein
VAVHGYCIAAVEDTNALPTGDASEAGDKEEWEAVHNAMGMIAWVTPSSDGSISWENAPNIRRDAVRREHCPNTRALSANVTPGIRFRSIRERDTHAPTLHDTMRYHDEIQCVASSILCICHLICRDLGTLTTSKTNPSQPSPGRQRPSHA